ncbi:MAG: hypothetical protein GXO74_09845 [Calditrichaeota bacterium]|nr:hypothetical protein [Calditrichota bacterium]
MMKDLAELLERELEGAFEVKDKKSLHRYVKLLTANIVDKGSYDQNMIEQKSDIRLLAETMKEGFKAIDKRFEDMQRYMDKRFEDMNKRFNMMFTFMNIGFGIIILLTILFKFVH